MSEPIDPKPFEWEPLPDKVRILVTTFTYAKKVGADVSGYTNNLPYQMLDHPRAEQLIFSYSVGYPTTRARNTALKGAADNGFQFVLMLDDDQYPDMYLGEHEDAVPFLPTALDFALAHDGPCLVGAPYCSGPPGQQVVVMKNVERTPDLPAGCGYQMVKYTREEAAVMTGITRVGALPTGCLLVDTRVTQALAPPWFYYEYEDEPFQTQLASTEDVVFTRNADWVGVPSYCVWQSWAGHSLKDYLVGKPRLSPVDAVPRAVFEAYQKGFKPKLIG